jgi:hypothetical protein
LYCCVFSLGVWPESYASGIKWGYGNAEEGISIAPFVFFLYAFIFKQGIAEYGHIVHIFFLTKRRQRAIIFYRENSDSLAVSTGAFSVLDDFYHKGVLHHGLSFYPQ